MYFFLSSCTDNITTFEPIYHHFSFFSHFCFSFCISYIRLVFTSRHQWDSPAKLNKTAKTNWIMVVQVVVIEISSWWNHYVFTHTLTILNNLDKEKARLTGRTSTFLTEKKNILKQLNCSLYRTRLFFPSPCIYCSPSRSIHLGNVPRRTGGKLAFSLGTRDPKRFGRSE